MKIELPVRLREYLSESVKDGCHMRYWLTTEELKLVDDENFWEWYETAANRQCIHSNIVRFLITIMVVAALYCLSFLF